MCALFSSPSGIVVGAIVAAVILAAIVVLLTVLFVYLSRRGISKGNIKADYI